MRAGKDSLAVPLMAKWENRKTLARAYGTSRRASGWAGENVARSGGLIRAIRGKGKQASLEELYLVARCGLAWVKARPGAKSLYWQTQGGRVKYRQGWAGEKSGLFEHSARGSPVVLDVRAIEFPPCHNSFSADS